MLLLFLENVVAPIFYKLLYMSATALVVGVIILLIRRVGDKWFSPFWKYAIWGLMLVALLLPWRPQSDFAVMDNTEKIQDISFHTEYRQAQNEYQQASLVQAENALPDAPPAQLLETKAAVDSLYIKTVIIDYSIPALWLCGAVMIGLFMAVSGLRLGRKIKKSSIAGQITRYESLLQSCKNKLGIKRRVRIVMQSHVKTPALFGLLRPQIILPDYAENLSDAHLQHVIMHELSHLRRADGVVNSLLLLLQAVYWFNPLTWFLFKYIREDMELANDAAVLKGMDTEKQKEYSRSLVAVLAGYDRPSLAPRLLCMMDSEKNMERRINMIKLSTFFRKRKWVIGVSAMLVILVTAALFLTAGAHNEDTLAGAMKNPTTKQETMQNPETEPSATAPATAANEPTSEHTGTSAPNPTKKATIKTEPLVKSILFKSAREVEAMSDAQLLEFAAGRYTATIPGFYEKSDLGVPLKDGETWGAISPSSANSVEEAIGQIKEFGFLRDAVSCDIAYIGETEYYYSFRITHTSDVLGSEPDKRELVTYTERYLVYKEKIKFYSHNVNTGWTIRFRVLDSKTVRELLDLEVSLDFNCGRSPSLYRDFEETNSEYVYTYYSVCTVGGDWGMSDTAVLEKTVTRVNKKTGEYRMDGGVIDRDRQTIKQVEIPGTYHPNPVVVA